VSTKSSSSLMFVSISNIAQFILAGVVRPALKVCGAKDDEYDRADNVDSSCEKEHVPPLRVRCALVRQCAYGLWTSE